MLPVDPRRMARDARVVRSGFWRKLRRCLGFIPFAEEAVASYYATIDPATPRHIKAAILGALAYFVLPTDIIPDFLAGLGFADDASVFWATWSLVSGHVTERHRTEARRMLEQPQPPGPMDRPERP